MHHFVDEGLFFHCAKGKIEIVLPAESVGGDVLESITLTHFGLALLVQLSLGGGGQGRGRVEIEGGNEQGEEAYD